jgi:uncharacterized protein YjiS (DUF1127 family)
MVPSSRPEKSSGQQTGWLDLGYGWLSWLTHCVRIWRERSQQRWALGHMDVDRLRDIGVPRDQAEKEASKWFWQE